MELELAYNVSQQFLERGEIHSRGTWGSIFDRKIPCPSKRMFFNMDTEAL